MRWLIVWGTASHEVRIGEGTDEQSAAQDAFGRGCYNRELMTFKPITLTEARNDKRRVGMILDLLKEHRDRFMPKSLTDPYALDITARAIDAISKIEHWYPRKKA